MKSIMLIAGEASGDMYGAHLAKALHACDATVHLCGMGGKAMRAAGVDLIVDADQVSVMGITEAFSKLWAIWQARSRLKASLSQMRPDLLILIDFPGFNLHLAGIAKSLGVKVLYYISPKVWAWRPKRVKKIKARVNHMAIILPFEQAFYEKHGVPVTFVGHPLMDTVNQASSEPRTLPSDGSKIIIALCPGSRRHEVDGLLPRMLEAGKILQGKFTNAHFLISCAPSIEKTVIQDIVARHRLPHSQIVDDPAGVLFPKSHFAMVASGTVTLEAAIYCTPMIITYSVSQISYWLGKALIRVDHIGLVNLIAQKRLSPELIQDQATPEALYDAAYAILSSPEKYNQHCNELITVKQRLGRPGASDNVARLAFSIMEGSIS